jgi:aspartate kinase
MVVMKFGGTSVGSALRMKEVSRIVDTGEQVLVVLSAVSGTTNSLVEINDAFSSGDKKKGISLIEKLEEKYHQLVNELYNSDSYKTAGTEIIRVHFDLLRSFAENGFTQKQAFEILAQGELISTQLFYQLLLEEGKKAALLNALDFMRIDEEGEPQMDYLREHIKPLLEKNKETFLITQGFICRNPKGEIANLRRGGSDYSASLIGAAINVSEIQIWTDIDGMHNNDPRIVNDTYPIRNLSFDEAAELAYFGAKILHPSSVNPARTAGIPVRLKNTMQPEAEGTLISAISDRDTIKAVAAKDKITAIRIVSNRMLLAYGFLRKVFEVFERYKTPIDMISTSEVAVSITIDNDQFLDGILTELKEIANVEIDYDLTIICVVGDNLLEHSGFGAKIFESLKEVPVRMVSFGGSKNNVSLLIHSSEKVRALNMLHAGLFKKELA